MNTTLSISTTVDSLDVCAVGAKSPLNKQAYEPSTSKIMIVDDISVNIKVVQAFLVNAGYEIFDAHRCDAGS